MFKFSAFFFLAVVVAVSVEASNDATKRKHLKDCVSKELDKENHAASADLKLTDDQLLKLKKIVYSEVDKEPLRVHSDAEQKTCYQHMEESAKKVMPEVNVDKLDKILHKVKEMSMHCLKEL